METYGAVQADAAERVGKGVMCHTKSAVQQSPREWVTTEDETWKQQHSVVAVGNCHYCSCWAEFPVILSLYGSSKSNILKSAAPHVLEVLTATKTLQASWKCDTDWLAPVICSSKFVKSGNLLHIRNISTCSLYWDDLKQKPLTLHVPVWQHRDHMVIKCLMYLHFWFC